LKTPKPYPIKPKGFSLVELMVSLALGIVVLTGVFKMQSSTLDNNAHSLKLSRISQEMRSALDVIKSDIKRSGYWRNANLNTNNTFGSLMISQDNSCISFTYDANNNGVLDQPGDEFGFRLSQGAIEARAGADACDTVSPTRATWAPITDIDSIIVNNLAFTKKVNCLNISTQPFTSCNINPAATGEKTINTTSITIDIQGVSASDSNITMQVSDAAMLRNDIVTTIQ